MELLFFRVKVPELGMSEMKGLSRMIRVVSRVSISSLWLDIIGWMMHQRLYFIGLEFSSCRVKGGRRSLEG